MLSKKEQQLLDALAPRAEQEGVEIVTVEVAGAKKAPTIRVYIDTPDGVSFDELSSAQAWINDLMDELDPFPGAYTLEVSSPGRCAPRSTSRGSSAIRRCSRRSPWTVAAAGPAPSHRWRATWSCSTWTAPRRASLWTPSNAPI